MAGGLGCKMVGSRLGLIIVIEIDGRPTVAFQAAQLREAYELYNEAWFRADQRNLKSKGVPLMRSGAKLKPGMANAAERTRYEVAVKDVGLRMEPDAGGPAPAVSLV